MLITFYAIYGIFVTKYVLLQYTLFCHKTCFGPVNTLSIWKRKDPKTCVIFCQTTAMYIHMLNLTFQWLPIALMTE